MPIIVILSLFTILITALLVEEETITVKACKELTCDCKCSDIRKGEENAKK
jgi:hypothetical protein